MINIVLPEFLFVAERWDFINYKPMLQRKEKNRGIYVLFDCADKVLYVGKSRRLYSCVRSHINGKGTSVVFAKHIAKIGVIPVDRLEDLDIYETHAINTLTPKYNKDKVYKTEEELRLLEFQLTGIAGEVERYRDEIAYLLEEDPCTLRDIDLQHARDELQKYRSEYRRISDILDDYGR